MLYNALRVRALRKLLLRNSLHQQQRAEAGTFAGSQINSGADQGLRLSKSINQTSLQASTTDVPFHVQKASPATLPEEESLTRAQDASQIVVPEASPIHLTFATKDPAANVVVQQLSDIFVGKDKWKGVKNSFGDPAMVNYALCEPFQLFDSKSASQLLDLAKQYLDSDFEYSTSRTSACIRACPALENAIVAIAPQLEQVATRLVGEKMKMHGFRLESAHVNVQRGVQEGPVDDWHQDSTPFVLVTALTEHSADPGGNLLVEKEEGAHYKCKLTQPGEAVLMQGSIIPHCAQQSEIGERYTIVTSFFVDSPLVYDSTSMRVAAGYSPPARCIDEYLRHVLKRLVLSGAATATQETRELQQEVERIMKMEVVKLKKEHELTWELIPENRRGSREVAEAWGRLYYAADRLEAAGHYEDIVRVANECLSNLMRLRENFSREETANAI